MNDWYSTQDAKRAAFCANFVANIDQASALLGVLPSTFGAATEAAQAWLDTYAARLDTQKKLDAALIAFQKQAPQTEKTIRLLARQIKNKLDVPEQVLQLLELTPGGEQTTARVAAQAPTLRAELVRDTVLLKYHKLGHQAVALYSCRTGEDGFTLLGTYSLNRIEDARPNRVPGQPEQRQYYAVYVDRDQPTCRPSSTVSVVLGDQGPAAARR